MLFGEIAVFLQVCGGGLGLCSRRQGLRIDFLQGTEAVAPSVILGIRV